MCITCRSRYLQKTLIRLKFSAKEVIAFDGIGRSFYLCHECSQNQKKVRGLVKRFKQNEERFTKLLIQCT
ncbi:MAG: DUF448 domain-containing protein [Sulfurovum sp.]|nr:DUF448 domain-containing protein [Sulfurovum sp.]